MWRLTGPLPIRLKAVSTALTNGMYKRNTAFTKVKMQSARHKPNTRGNANGGRLTIRNPHILMKSVCYIYDCHVE